MARTSAKTSSSKTSSAFLGNLVLFGGSVVPQSFHLGVLNIRYYSLALVAAIVAAYFISRYFAKKQGIGPKIFDDTVFWVLLFGFISARIYYVIFYFDQYRGNLLEVFKVWHGGIAIYGALIGGIATLYYICKKDNLDFWKFCDAIVIAMPLAQVIGRIGNFFNYEAFGKPFNGALKMFVPLQFRPVGYEQYVYFHPTFLYEMLWSLLVFIVLISLWGYIKSWERKKRAQTGMPGITYKAGIFSAGYLILYSIGRFAIESLRLDSAYISGLKVDQITALLLIIAGLGIIISRYVPQNSK